MTYIRCEEGPMEDSALACASSASVSGAKDDKSVVNSGRGTRNDAKKPVRIRLEISIGADSLSKPSEMALVKASLPDIEVPQNLPV